MTLKRTITFIMIICFSQFFFTCSEDSPTRHNSNNGDNIWPLKSGNNWAYVKDTNQNYVVQRIRVIGSQTLNKSNTVDVFKVVWENIEEAVNDTAFIKNENNGVYFYSEDANKVIIFKYPVNVGDSWNNPFEGGIIECISTSEPIETPAGNFNCIVYRFADEGDIEQSTFYLEVYMSPNIGWVAEQRAKDSGPGFDWFRLNSYELN